MLNDRARTPSETERQMVGVEIPDGEKATGTRDEQLGIHLLTQVVKTLWLPSTMSEEERSKAVRSAIAALKGIAPRGEIEGMLAAQMVGTHNAAMDCLRRAMIPGQSFEWREQNLKHATKLLGVYTRQLEALDKHRGKGQQKITVEHVQVHAGGQAIVGNVEASGQKAVAADPETPALEHNPAPVAPTFEAKETAKPKARSRRRL